MTTLPDHFSSLGYACINMTLTNVKPKKNRVTTNRTMRKATFKAKGLAYASELVLANATDLLTILKWNEQHGISFFRLSSEVCPWASEYELSSLPDFDKIQAAFKAAGDYAQQHGHRITSHPGPFNKLASSDERVIANTIRDLEIHGEVFDLMGLSRSPYNKINIHVGAAYGDKPSALKQFCTNFDKLSDSVKTRLTVENDDRPSLYSTKELYEGVFKQLGIPIVFDFHHYKFRSDLPELEALELAMSTWGKVKPVTHYSETKRNADGSDYKKPQAHSDYIFNPINDYGKEIDIMIEAKAKELALLRYRKEWNCVAE